MRAAAQQDTLRYLFEYSTTGCVRARVRPRVRRLRSRRGLASDVSLDVLLTCDRRRLRLIMLRVFRPRGVNSEPTYVGRREARARGDGVVAVTMFSTMISVLASLVLSIMA